jgi:hypothetical protein
LRSNKTNKAQDKGIIATFGIGSYSELVHRPSSKQSVIAHRRLIGSGYERRLLEWKHDRVAVVVEQKAAPQTTGNLESPLRIVRAQTLQLDEL